ncbi:MAG: hypothetical protein AMXMBFR84_42560 [Candidatus Hydrogenedentota bacterium]
MARIVCQIACLSLMLTVVLGLFPGVSIAFSDETTPPAFPPEAIEYFETRIRPVLAEHCYSCHGPETQKMGLRLDSRTSILKGGESGPALVAGTPESSLIVQVIQYTGTVTMPPKGKLDEAQIEAIREWVRLGAPWPEGEQKATETAEHAWEERFAEARASHWAFQPVTRPNPPAVPMEMAGLSPVDRFLRAKLDAAGLAPSPPAERRTLLRRATFDLTGLPPTPEETEAFVSDPSANAYENLIDRLLASPRYGERWARYWLDIARYSDTKGYVFQEERAFPYSHTYRDYVIRAFNEDMPYDQFIKQQIAADQMELPDRRNLAATGFLGVGRKFVGNIHDQIDDKIDVVTRGMLGLTVSCARCHDHKYDPIPAADYYSLYGIFRSTTEPAELPLIEDPKPDDPGYQSYLQQVAQAEAALEQLMDDLHVELLTHARDKAADYLLTAQETIELKDDEAFRRLSGERSLRWQLTDRWRNDLKERSARHDPVFAPWFAFAALPTEGFADQATALVALVSANKMETGPINTRIAAAFADAKPQNLADVANRYRAVFDEVSKLWADRLAARSQWAAREDKPLPWPDGLTDTDAEAIRQVLYGAASVANVPRGDVFDLNDVPTQGRIREKRNAIARVMGTHPNRPARAMAVQDAEKPFDPYIFKRGKPDQKGDKVPRQFLGVISAVDRKPFEKGSGRLELAEAIASTNNPLTARVIVNRVWMYHFGQPLVDSTSDFGVRSAPPTHPELMDYLAAEFMDNGWSIKKLHRAIMLTEAYRQSSTYRPEAASIDPENKLIWRQNRQRLDFEAMRDAILASSGNIDLSMGGPSVDITNPPHTTRRSVYSYIERQNLPALFRTFDFASPDTHSPRRFRTTVPQQALYLMNGPFLVDQARVLATRSTQSANDPDGQIQAIYQFAYQRCPDEDEVALAKVFLEQQAAKPAPVPPWKYGYGSVSVEENRVTSFSLFPFFGSNTWKGGDAIPDPTLGWAMITDGGGHPGGASTQCTILRWTATDNGVAEVKGALKHGSDQGDGVTGFAVSSRGGIRWNSTVFNGESESHVEGIEVAAGDTIDFVVAAGANESFDSYEWTPRIVLRTSDGAPIGEWESKKEFAGPPPVPLTPWEQYAQVLLMTNEFLFVD